MILNTACWFLALGQPRGPGEGQQTNPYAFVGQFILIGAALVIMYMLLIRPQRKREQKRRSMIDNLKEKDQVVTIGGIYGKVVSIKEHYLVLNVDKDTNIRISKGAVSRVIPPGEEDTGEDLR